MLRSHGWWFEPYETGLPKKQNFCFSQLIKHSFNFIVKILSLSLSWWKLDRTFTPTSSALLILKIKDGWKFRRSFTTPSLLWFRRKMWRAFVSVEKIIFFQSSLINQIDHSICMTLTKKEKRKILIINNPKINY